MSLLCKRMPSVSIWRVGVVGAFRLSALIYALRKGEATDSRFRSSDTVTNHAGASPFFFVRKRTLPRSFGVQIAHSYTAGLCGRMSSRKHDDPMRNFDRLFNAVAKILESSMRVPLRDWRSWSKIEPRSVSQRTVLLSFQLIASFSKVG
jgi:hypothetical protein